MEAQRRSDLLCERTRSYVSLDLDGELSEFERRFLVAHVRHCGDCRSYRFEVRALTNRLRATPPEVPARGVRVPARVSSRRSVLQARVPLGVAAALAIAVVGSASLATSTIHRAPATSDRQETVESLTTRPSVVLSGPVVRGRNALPGSSSMTRPLGRDVPL